jgi:hypothetical protein
MMRLLALTAFFAALSGLASAQEDILWRVTNSQAATVVPAYGGQPSPFPAGAAASNDVSSTLSAEEEDKRRQKAEALQKAEQLLASRLAITPEMRAISVGGRIEGAAGPKVLINDQWVGINTEVWVMVTKSQKALEAIKTLRDYDTEAADELDRRLNASISANPRLKMKLTKILPDALIFSTPEGTQKVPFKLESDND